MTQAELNARAAAKYSDERSKQLATHPVGRLLLQFATPSIIAMAAASIYNICDSIFIGQGVNAMAIAGLAITFPLMNISSAFGAMAGVGGGAQTSVRMGEGNQHQALKIFGNVLCLDLVIGLTLTTLGLIYIDEILAIFGASEVTLPYARDYMQIILLGNIITHTFLGMNDQLRATGNPRYAMCAQLIAVISNIILDALFIFGFGWGMRGAALATILGQAIAWVFEAYFLMYRKNLFVYFSWRYLRMRWSIVREILAIGVSPFSVNFCACMVVILINHTLTEQGGADGDIYVGVYGIVNRIALLLVMCVMGFSQGMQPIVGFNIGARLYHRVLGTLKFAYLFATAIMTFGYMVIALFARELAGAFTNDPYLIDLCTPAIRIVLCIFPLVGGQIISGSFFQSIRNAKISMLISVSRLMLILTPMLLILPDYFAGRGWSGVYGVWCAMPTSDLLSAILAGILLYRQVSRMKRISEEQLRKTN